MVYVYMLHVPPTQLHSTKIQTGIFITVVILNIESKLPKNLATIMFNLGSCLHWQKCVQDGSDN